jgi:hypothetical protein
LKVVISQPMLFPWVGLLEQIRLADVYVHYDDVPFSKGSFVNRVQVKTAAGSRWLTIPLRDHHLGQKIQDVRTADTQAWRARHLAVLEQAYEKAPHAADMLDIVRRAYSLPSDRLADVVIASMQELCAYFELVPQSVVRSSELGIGGSGWPRVLAIVGRLGGSAYVSGHGGYNYLDHEAFEAAGVTVEYMRYERIAYPQQHGPFTASVTALDLVANVGRAGRGVITSGTVPWRTFEPR